MAEGHKITVAIESVIHDALKDVLQGIFDNSGIVVNRADVSWVDVSIFSEKPRRVITGISLESGKPFQ